MRGGAVGVVAAAVGYWWIVAAIGGVREPWDSPLYLPLFYPLSIALAGLCGRMAPRGRWAWGAVVTFAQLPVMLVLSGMGPLLAVGLVFLVLLSVIPTLVSVLAARRG